MFGELNNSILCNMIENMDIVDKYDLRSLADKSLIDLIMDSRKNLDDETFWNCIVFNKLEKSLKLCAISYIDQSFNIFAKLKYSHYINKSINNTKGSTYINVTNALSDNNSYVIVSSLINLMLKDIGYIDDNMSIKSEPGYNTHIQQIVNEIKSYANFYDMLGFHNHDEDIKSQEKQKDINIIIPCYTCHNNDQLIQFTILKQRDLICNKRKHVFGDILRSKDGNLYIDLSGANHDRIPTQHNIHTLMNTKSYEITKVYDYEYSRFEIVDIKELNNPFENYQVSTIFSEFIYNMSEMIKSGHNKCKILDRFNNIYGICKILFYDKSHIITYLENGLLFIIDEDSFDNLIILIN